MYKRRGEYSELVNVICSRACRNVTYFCSLIELEGFAGGSAVKNPHAMQEMLVRSLSQEEPLEEGEATHSSILAWRIPWAEEPGGLQFIGSQGVRRN